MSAVPREDEEGSGFSAEIAKADRMGLLSFVEENLRRFTDRDVLQVLRHPYCGEQVIEAVMAARRFTGVRRVRKLVALHPAAPRDEALRCLEDLPWRDLLDISREARTPMPVRLRASQWIMEKLAKLSIGEKMTLGRLADRPVIPRILKDPSQRVLEAVLLNPRLLEEDLLAWISTARPLPESLSTLSLNEKWMSRPEVRRALIECRETPRALSLSLLSRCSRMDLRRVVGNPGADPLLVACAESLIEAARIDEAAEIL
jgi:hypothetical protein